MLHDRKPAVLMLEDGTRFDGWSYAREGVTVGEVVFNTSLSGYQEILTDPSYHRQMVTMTAPQIGNYGVNSDDAESERVFAAGFIIKAPSRIPSNWRSEMPLETWLQAQNVVGICGVDTRALVRKLRAKGAMLAAIGPRETTSAELQAAIEAEPSMSGRDLATEVSCKTAYRWSNGNVDEATRQETAISDGKPFKVVAMDFGVKRNILRLLAAAGCDVTVVPSKTSFEEILALGPDGVFLSNGPGDPAAVDYALPVIKKLLGELPVFGICLGHQLACLALGASSYKMTFGHRGGNQPVLDVDSGRVEITSQNHGFAIDPAGLPSGVYVSHVHLNDQTCAGVRAPALQFLSVQFHPEASPGPHDSRPLFDEFVAMMQQRRDRG